MECFWSMFFKLVLVVITMVTYVFLTAVMGIIIAKRIDKRYPIAIGLVITVLGFMVFVCLVECNIINLN